jgi:hypothetical protein
MEIIQFAIYDLIMKYKIIFSAFLLFFLNGCSGNEPGSVKDTTLKPADSTSFQKIIDTKKNSGLKTIHVFVALCDNKYQGIVPVPAKIGNGQDAANNLYWGAAYGVKTFFNKSSEWKLVEKQKDPAENILERLLFKHKTKNIYLLADAYDGQFIKQTTIDFLLACSGKGTTTVKNNNTEITFGGAADILAYVGHDGLMDFSLDEEFEKQNNEQRKAIMLACISKKYFSPHLKHTGAEPLLWSTGLMAPEAYILHDALNKWIDTGDAAQTRSAAAVAYSKYQRCSLNAAKNLLVTGW